MVRRIQTIIIITVARAPCHEMKIQNTLWNGSFNNSGWEFRANNPLHAFIFCSAVTYSYDMGWRESEFVRFLYYFRIVFVCTRFLLLSHWLDAHTSTRYLVALIADLGIRFVASGNVPAHSSEFEFDTCRRDIEKTLQTWRAIAGCWQPLVFRCVFLFVILSIATVRDEVGATNEEKKLNETNWRERRQFSCFFFPFEWLLWLLTVN